MKNEETEMLTGELLEEGTEMSLTQLCRACKLSEAEIVNLVEEGIIDPMGHEPEVWRFQSISLRRVRITRNLQQELGVNTPGAALALDLLEELEELRRRLRRLESQTIAMTGNRLD
jgi:chaperone modulatory protein CbpM